jgi:LPS-assembly protein
MNSQESKGQVYYNFFDQFHASGLRWNFSFQHQEEFAEDLSGRVDINLVSDENYFYDLDKKLENKSRPYLDSNAFYVERWNTASLYLMGQYTIDLTQTNGKTVQKLPELRYTIYDESLAGPLHLSFEGSAANFTSQDEGNARRVDFNPRLLATFGSNGLNVTPNAGVRATFYDRSATTVEPTERKYFYAGTDVNARVSRVYGVDGDVGIGKVRHSIEPTISYNYVPHVEQGNIPQFDSVDTVPEQNAVSIALINRVTAHYKETKDSPNYTTFDVIVTRISYTYDFTIAREHGSETHPASDVLAELYLRTPKTFSMSATGSYNAYDHVWSSHSETLGFTRSVVSLNLTHSFSKGGAESLISGGGLTLGKWNLHAQVARDIQNKKTTQEEYILHYVSQCWGLSLTSSHTPGDYSYKAMIDLKGFGSRGTK